MANENTAKKPSLFSRVKRFFKDIFGELKKVAWPSKKQVINNTLVVLAMIAVFAVVVWGLDFVFAWLRDALIQAFV